MTGSKTYTLLGADGKPYQSASKGQLGGHLTINDEVSGFQRATPGEVKAMAGEAFAVRILDAIEDHGQPAVRQHDGIQLA